MSDTITKPAPNLANRRLAVGGVIVMMAIAGLLIWAVSAPPATPAVSNLGPALVEGETFEGFTEVNPPKPLQDFTLTNQDGQLFSLHDLQGRLTLLFFGFTHCPDVCPLTLVEFRQIRQALGDDADQVTLVFISVDGERDTPAALKDYISRFDPTIIGLTGDETTLRRIGTDYNLYFAKNFGTGSQADYLIDHTANSFLVDRQNRLVAVFPFQTDADLIAQHIRSLLAGAA